MNQDKVKLDINELDSIKKCEAINLSLMWHINDLEKFSVKLYKGNYNSHMLKIKKGYTSIDKAINPSFINTQGRYHTIYMISQEDHIIFGIEYRSLFNRDDMSVRKFSEDFLRINILNKDKNQYQLHFGKEQNIVKMFLTKKEVDMIITEIKAFCNSNSIKFE